MLQRIFDLLAPAPQSAPNRPRTNVTGAAQRVLVLDFNPVIEAEGGRRLTDVLRWNDPYKLEQQYIDDMHHASNGQASYEVVEHRVLDEWPRKQDGFQYTDDTFLRAWRSRQGFHQPDGVDYADLIARYDLYSLIDRDEIDEVWLFGPPYAGFWESTMAGPGAFWCNSPPVATRTGCSRRFVIMGFNYERDVGCMLENFGHRTESIMREVYTGMSGERNLWERFIRYDTSTPGRASCGNVHFAPNSVADYDWGNRRVVSSDCDAWLNFPDLSASRRSVDCREWGNGDMRGHHIWWLEHLPAAPGSTDGISNNWWEYILVPDRC